MPNKLATPEVVSTGLSGLDDAIGGLKTGENVVWQINDLADYIYVANRFVMHVARSGQRIVYFRFGEHQEIMDAEAMARGGANTKKYVIDPHIGFESFTVKVNRIIQEDWVSIYGNDGFNTIRQTLGLTYDEFRNLMACNLKSQKIIEYYYGEGGPNEVTLDEMKEYYANNFVRFKYIVLMTQDSKGNKYGEDKMNEITNNKATIMAALENKTSTFEDLIVKYSDDYTEITTDMTSSEKEAAEKQNKTILEDGLIIDSEGVFDKNLATYYNVVVDSDIVDKVFGMKNGEFVSVKLDDSIWIIQRYANDEKAEYFEDVKEMTYQALYQDDFAAKHTDWRNRLNYVYNEAVIDAYKPENLADLFDFATKGY